MLYFDHNATSPLLPEARQAWLEAVEKYIGNPSSPHRVGARAEAALNEARARLAARLGCDALDLIWTSGATEANNLVMHHVAATTGRDRAVWVSSIEHPCVLEPARHYFGSRLQCIPVERSGAVDLNWLRERLPPARPACVAVLAANNETGVLQPWREVLALCREFGVSFFCDATQWIGRLPAAGLGDCDFVSGSAHKFGGPKGVGFLKCPAQGRIEPLFRGGKQEEGRRAGTENVPGILAMLAGLDARNTLAQGSVPRSPTLSMAENPAGAAELQARLVSRGHFEQRLLASLPGAEIVGRAAPRLWNTVAALMPEADCQQRWVVKLDKLGFAVSTGSACSSGREDPSHVLSAMGYAPAQTGRVLRFSGGWETTECEWLALADALAKVAQGWK